MPLKPTRSLLPPPSFRPPPPHPPEYPAPRGEDAAPPRRQTRRRHRRRLPVDFLKHFSCLKCAPGSLSSPPAAASLRLIQTRWSGRRCQVVLIAQLSPPRLHSTATPNHLKRHVLTDVAPCRRWLFFVERASRCFFPFRRVGNTLFV